MTIKQVQKAADLRGIRFDGKKKWLNNTVGYGYEIFSPNGRRFYQADTLEGLYKAVMKYERIR